MPPKSKSRGCVAPVIYQCALFFSTRSKRHEWGGIRRRKVHKTFPSPTSPYQTIPSTSTVFHVKLGATQKRTDLGRNSVAKWYTRPFQRLHLHTSRGRNSAAKGTKRPFQRLHLHNQLGRNSAAKGTKRPFPSPTSPYHRHGRNVCLLQSA